VPNPPAEKGASPDHDRQNLLGRFQGGPRGHPGAADFAGKEDGRLFLHGEEWFENAGDYLQYKLFMRRADPNFVLRANGQPDVSCRLSLGFVTRSSAQLRELEGIIPAAEYAKMAKGVAYTLHPVNGKQGYVWKVRDSVTVTRE